MRKDAPAKDKGFVELDLVGLWKNFEIRILKFEFFQTAFAAVNATALSTNAPRLWQSRLESYPPPRA